MVRVHKFPASVLSGNDSFVNDIVVDEANGLAYMSNTWDQGGIVVYDWTTDASRRFDHPTMHAGPNSNITINGKQYVFGGPSDGTSAHWLLLLP